MNEWAHRTRFAEAVAEAGRSYGPTGMLRAGNGVKRPIRDVISELGWGVLGFGEAGREVPRGPRSN